MNIRDALINQSPSLALQRAAADEIASLDSEVGYLSNLVCYAKKKLRNMEDYLEAHDLTEEFEEWLARNTEP